MPRPPKPTLPSFKYAIEGIVHVFRTQRHMRFHFAVATAMVILGVMLSFTRMEWFMLFFAVALVMLTEMLNTAIEACVDLATDGYHPLAKIAKDIAAGAVFIATITAILIAFLLLFNTEIWERIFAVSITDTPADIFQAGVSGFVLLMLLTVISKTLGNKGTFLSGGVVSGHSALGFYLSTSILFISNQFPTAFLAMCIAALVAQSRVQARIHTTREVLIGALLGITVPTVLFTVAPWLSSVIARWHESAPL